MWKEPVSWDDSQHWLFLCTIDPFVLLPFFHPHNKREISDWITFIVSVGAQVIGWL